MRGSRALRAYVGVCDSGEPWVQEVTYDTPFGDGYMLGTFVQRIAKLGDGLVVFLTDVTEQRRMEADLRNYADVVAHDLREPVAGMALLVSLLERRAAEPPPPDVLRLLREGTERARDLIDGVLAYARVGELEVESVALDRVLAEVAEDLRPGLEEAGATLEVGELPGRGRSPAASPGVPEPRGKRPQVPRRGAAAGGGLGLPRRPGMGGHGPRQRGGSRPRRRRAGSSGCSPASTPGAEPAPSSAAPVAVAWGCSPDQGGEAGRVQCGGHGHQGEVPAELADLTEHAQQQVGLEAALVHLVQDDSTGGLQSGIVQEPAQQDSGSDELHQGAGPGLAFAADGVPDAVPHLCAVQGGQTPGGRAGGDAPWLGDHHPQGLAGRGREPGGGREVGKQRRDQGGLPVPGGASTTAVPAVPPARSTSASSPSEAAKARPVPMVPRSNWPGMAVGTTSASGLFDGVTRPLSSLSLEPRARRCGRMRQTGRFHQ